MESDDEEGAEAAAGGGGGLKHALGVIERLQEQLRLVRGDKQALEERCYILQRENASLLAGGAAHAREHATATTAGMSACLSAAAEMKALEGEAKEARRRRAVLEKEVAAEREESRALRARLASGVCVGVDGMIWSLYRYSISILLFMLTHYVIVIFHQS